MKRIIAALIVFVVTAAGLAGCGKLTYPQAEESDNNLPVAVIEVKDFGTIKAVLYSKEAPKAVENFITHTQEGYYNGLSFHRVLQGFMIQSGDPMGNGRGGESIWGEPFKDEFNENLRHFRGALSMANSGPDSNGSQFFIVQSDGSADMSDSYFSEIEESNRSAKKQIKEINEQLDQQITEAKKNGSSEDELAVLEQNKVHVAEGELSFSDDVRALYRKIGGAPHLDKRYTVFGQVIEGMDVVDRIAAVEVEMVNGEPSSPVEPVIITQITME